MRRRPAFVTLPGLSTTSMVVNLPYLLSATNQTPLLIMDTRDYERLRAKALTDGGSQKYHYLSMIYDSLRRRGLLTIIDYADYYPEAVQAQNVQHNESYLQDLPYWVNKQSAVKAVDGWINYARPSHQESIRAALGEDVDSFADLRQTEYQQKAKMQNETGDAISWNQKVLNKDVAALEVRKRLDETFPRLDVKYVIAGEEHAITGGLLDAARSQRNPAPMNTYLDVGRDIVDVDAPHLEELQPNRYMANLDSTDIKQSWQLFDRVTDIATDITGGNEDDFLLLGHSMAMPNYDDIFDFGVVRAQLAKKNPDEIATEAEYVVNQLESGEQNHLGPSQLRYEADKILEMEGFDPTIDTNERGASIAGVLDYAMTLPDHSRELRYLLEGNHVSQAGAFVGVSVYEDPSRRETQDSLYRESIELMNRIDPPELDEKRLEEIQKERRGDEWDDHADWFEVLSRWR